MFYITLHNVTSCVLGRRGLLLRAHWIQLNVLIELIDSSPRSRFRTDEHQNTQFCSRFGNGNAVASLHFQPYYTVAFDFRFRRGTLWFWNSLIIILKTLLKEKIKDHWLTR